MMYYLWLIPLVIVVYVMYAWLTKQSHEIGGIYFWILAICPTPIWAIVTKVSKNLVFDAMICYIVLLLSFTGGLIWFGMTAGFNTYNYIGLAIAILGVILMRV